MWSCTDKQTKETRAVKITQDKTCNRKCWSAEHGKQIPEEATLWLPLSHPNLVKLLEVFYIPATKYWFLVMDYDHQYVELFNHLDKNGPLSSANARVVTRQIIEVVNYLISCGVDHRDIKDENILIHPTTLHVKLLDLGSASKMTPDVPYTSCQGTEVYTPPEFYRHRRYYPLPGLVWSLGCLVHCLIAGDGPFRTRQEVKQYSGVEWVDNKDVLAKDFVERCMMRDETERMKVEELLGHRWFNEPEIDPSLV